MGTTPNTTPLPGTSPSSSGTARGGSNGPPKNGIATLRSEQDLGVAASPEDEKRKTDMIEQQGAEAINKTQRETAVTPSGQPVLK
jgi:hypothetical protein